MTGLPTASTMFLLSVMEAVGIVPGAFWGYKVLDTAACRITGLIPLTGLTAWYSQALF